MKTTFFSKMVFLLILSFIILNEGNSQVLINTTGGVPDASAMLDIESDSKGLLIPRLTTDQRTTLSLTAVDGLLVFDSEEKSFYVFGNGAWVNLSSSAGIWLQNASDVYVNDISKKVGIGTDIPALNTRLHVLLSGTPLASQFIGTVASFQSDFGAGYWSRVSIIGGNAGASVLDLGDADSQQAGRISYEHTDNFMAFHTDDTEKMRITSSGNVGIGTIIPSAPLEVISSTSFQNLILAGYSTSPNKLRLSSGNNSAIISAGDAYDVNKGIVIDHTTGNVGIGKSGAVTKLDVNGEITTTGGNSENWNTAFAWGDHSTEGYLTSFTETDPSLPPGTTPGEMLYWNGTAWIVVAASVNEAATLQMIGGVPIWTGGTPPPTPVTSPITGRIWMDRNLGASQVATSSTDALAYGDLYQWGRGTDGHQSIYSLTISTLSSTDLPGHGYFITSALINYDWRQPRNDNLWQGVTGVNNPCPEGYRLPVAGELDEERINWSSQNAAGAFASFLKLPAPGFRLHSSGSPSNVGVRGYYWSSTVEGFNSYALIFDSIGAYVLENARAGGFSVRCIKDY